MVDSVDDILKFGGNISDHTTFGSTGLDEFSKLSKDSLNLVGNIDQVSLGDGGIWVKDMVDSVDDILKLGGNISDHTTFGSWGEDFADLSNNSLNLVGNVDQISLGDGGIWVENMVDSVDDILKLGGNISDHTTFGSTGLDEFSKLSNDSFNLMGNVGKISLGDGGIWV